MRNSSSSGVAVVIPAGGAGLRFGGRTPKQFIRLKGRLVLCWTVAAFDSMKSIGEIVVVAPKKYVRSTVQMLSRHGFRKVATVVAGGSTRQASVWNGLNALTRKPGIVLVHDAVRPLITPGTVHAVIKAAKRYGAAVTGIPVRDTIKLEGRAGFYTQTLERNKLWTVQTPQGFKYDLLVRAHRSARRARHVGTDESSLVERLGVPVRIVPGDERNLKITSPADLELAEFLMK